MTFAYPTNITKIVDIAVYTNSVTSGMFWPLILFALFCILFFSFKSYPAERAFATSSFITMIIAIMFGIIGLVSAYVYVACIILAAIGIICLRNSNNKEY